MHLFLNTSVGQGKYFLSRYQDYNTLSCFSSDNKGFFACIHCWGSVLAHSQQTGLLRVAFCICLDAGQLKWSCVDILNVSATLYKNLLLQLVCKPLCISNTMQSSLWFPLLTFIWWIKPRVLSIWLCWPSLQGGFLLKLLAFHQTETLSSIKINT